MAVVDIRLRLPVLASGEPFIERMIDSDVIFFQLVFAAILWGKIKDHMDISLKVKVNVRGIALCNEPHSLLRKLKCHMGLHSVTCHPAEVTFPPLTQPKLVLDLAISEGCKAELT